MAYTLFLIILLVSLAGVIAYAGDRLGTFIGRKRLSFFGMRPKRSGQVIGIIAGVVIMLTTLGVSSLAFREAAAVLISAQQSANGLRILKQEKAQLDAELIVLKKQVLDFQQDVVFFRQELQQTRKNLRAVVSERDNAKNGLEKVNGQLVNAQETLQNVEIELENAKSERKSALEAAKVAQEEMLTLQTQVSKAEERLSSATQELAQLQVQLRTSQDSLQNSRGQLKQVEADLADTLEEFDLQQRLIADLKFKGQNTRANLTILQWQAQQLQERILNLIVQAADLRQQNNSLTVANETLAKDNHSLAVVNQALEGENGNLQEQIVTLNQELNKSSEELKKAREDISKRENRRIAGAGQLLSSHQLFITTDSPKEAIRNEVNNLSSKTSNNLRSMGMLATNVPSVNEVGAFSNLLSQLSGPVVIGAIAEDEIYIGEEASVCFVVLR